MDGEGGASNSQFAKDYRRLVTPVLTREIFRLAGELADDRLSFGEAMGELMSLAHQRGAGYLPDDAYDDLRDWASSTLLTEACRVEDAMELVVSLLREPSRDVLRQRIRDFLDGR